MRPLNIGRPPRNGTVEQRLTFIENALMEISRASRDIDAMRISDSFTPSNVTKTRTFDANSTTLAEIADVLGTLIEDMKTRGQKRT